ncbi:hypothetical protein XENTR_v10008245 [Xenopus tropicalis]|nr:hypothetical protein XENTR_v10008245 [Xenopus tropicalis]
MVLLVESWLALFALLFFKESWAKSPPILREEFLLRRVCPPLKPSSIRTNNKLAGSSSMLHCTGVLHSGHFSSFLALNSLCRQGWQKVCWHGSTLALTSNFPRHKGQSRRSRTTNSSILFEICS